jgi:hypothetical protein
VNGEDQVRQFPTDHRARSCAEAIASRAMIEQFSLDLRQPHFPPPRGVRLVAVILSNFDTTTVAESGQTVLAIASREATLNLPD